MCVCSPNGISLIPKHGNGPSSAPTYSSSHMINLYSPWKFLHVLSCSSQLSRASNIIQIGLCLRIYQYALCGSQISLINPFTCVTCFPSSMSNQHLLNTTSWTVWLANFIQVTLSCVNKTLSYVQHRAKHKKALLRSELEYLTQVNQHKV